MPERRIDAAGKVDAAIWNSVQLSKGSANALRVISGQLSKIPGGEMMYAVVKQAGKGAFNITLNGETFIVKGLPASLLGKEVGFVARHTAASGKAGIDLFWTGPGRAQQAGIQANEQQSRPQTEILSRLPANLLANVKSGKIMAGQVDQIQAGKMIVNISQTDPVHPAKTTMHQIQIAVVNTLKQGQHFSARIQPGINNKAMLEILPQQQVDSLTAKAVAKPALALHMASFTLAAGEMTPAIVQKRLANGHIQLNVQGVTVETPAPKTVSQGDSLMLRMIKPPAEFQLISVQKNVAEKAMAVVKNNIPVMHEPLAQNITAIRNILTTLVASGMQGMDGLAALEAWLGASTVEQKQALGGERLARLMRDSGAGLEAKLLSLSQKTTTTGPQNTALTHDLKTIMLQLANVQSSNINHAGMLKILTELSQHSAARIETTQALNVLAQAQGEAIRFELPMLVGQQMVNVYMSLQQQEHQTSDDAQTGGGRDQSYNVLFALELSGLGNMRVDAAVSDTAVHARIYSDQTGVEQFIRNHLQRLETRLQDLGFKEVYLLASQSAPGMEKQRQFEQLTHMAPASLNLLDVIV